MLLPVLEARGLRSAGGDATFFLWLDAGPQAELLAERLLGEGSCWLPGSYFGPAGAGYLRLALVPAWPAASAPPSGSATCCASPVCRHTAAW